MRFDFVDYKVIDSGIVLHFMLPDPGPGNPSDAFVRIMDDEISGDPSTDLSLIEAKLNRKFKLIGISNVLDKMVGMKIVLDMTFVLISYEVLDSSIELHFLSPDPPGGEPEDYFVMIRDGDLVGDVETDSATIRAAVERKFKPTTLSQKLLAFSGWSIEI